MHACANLLRNVAIQFFVRNKKKHEQIKNIWKQKSKQNRKKMWFCRLDFQMVYLSMSTVRVYFLGTGIDGRFMCRTKKKKSVLFNFMILCIYICGIVSRIIESLGNFLQSALLRLMYDLDAFATLNIYLLTKIVGTTTMITPDWYRKWFSYILFFRFSFIALYRIFTAWMHSASFLFRVVHFSSATPCDKKIATQIPNHIVYINICIEKWN